MSEREQLQKLLDRAEIIDTIVRYAISLDTRDWEEMRKCLTDEVFMDFAFMELEPATFTAEEWIEFARVALSGFKATHHISPNHIITELEDDEATCISYMFAQHWLPNDRGDDFFLMRGHYVNGLVRTPEGWKISRMKQITTWTSGNPQLFDLAQLDLDDERVG